MNDRGAAQSVSIGIIHLHPSAFRLLFVQFGMFLFVVWPSVVSALA